MARPIESAPSAALPPQPPAPSGLEQPAAAEATLRSWASGIPRWVWALALFAAALHMAPYARATASAPDGWRFTGNLSVSPDYMQYRVWMRQTGEEGMLVTNRFTPEPNRPHLPVPFYYAVNRVSVWTSISPEWVYAWAGALIAFLLTIVLYSTVRHFIGGGRPAAWTLVLLLFGGGLGGYLKYLEESAWARSNYVIGQFLLAPLMGPNRVALFEDHRGNYLVQALFDTHFLLYWLVTTVAVLALYFAIRRFSAVRVGLMAAIFAAATFLHIYEGITLLVITAGVLFVGWRRGMAGHRALILFLTCGLAVAVVLLPIVWVYKGSGLPMPDWSGLAMPLPIVLIAYPLCWLIIPFGIREYWDRGGIAAAFLIGWALGGLALTLSGPFFPYPNRGTLTLQIPLFLMTASIWFARHRTVGWARALVVVLLIGSTSVRYFENLWERTNFYSDQPHKYVSDDHVATVRLLADRATTGDVLIAHPSSLVWLAPEYPGLHYAGHFFLTPQFTTRLEAVNSFVDAPPHEQAAFLEETGARFVYIEGDGRELDIPGLRPLRRDRWGTLWEFTPPTAAR